MKTLNINKAVKVKLTNLGKDLYYHQYDKFNIHSGKPSIQPSYPKVDENGYTSFQLWELMQLYGQSLTMGGTVESNTLPFETEIIID